jgi:hypothetical protein
MEESSRLLKKGQRVEITNKNVRGKIAYIGMASFAGVFIFIFTFFCIKIMINPLIK